MLRWEDFVLAPFLLQELLQLCHVGLLKFWQQVLPPRFFHQQIRQARLQALRLGLAYSKLSDSNIPARYMARWSKRCQKYSLRYFLEAK